MQTMAVRAFLVPTLMAFVGIVDADDRKAWHYTTQSKPFVLYHARDGEWEDVRPDDKEFVYEERDRTDEYVELQNRTTKLLLRLHADRGYWRRPSDTDWKRWVSGKWGEMPANVSAAVSNEPRDYVIRLGYFVPEDRDAIPNYEDKIRVVMAYTASLFRNDLQSKGFKTDGIRFETKDDLPVVHLIRGERPAAFYNNAPQYETVEQWRRVVPEVDAALGDRRQNLCVVFAETYEEGPSEYLWPGVIARGSWYTAEGGMAIYTSHILRDEFCQLNIADQRRLFFDRTPLRGRRALGHPPNTPRCEFVEDGFGAVMHELGHALGLPHDRRDEQRFIMGNGFRHIRENLGASRRSQVGFSDENSWLLMSSRYLASDLDTTDTVPPQLVDVSLARHARGSTLDIKASDNTGLRALVIFDENAGSIVGGQQLKGTETQLELAVPTKVGGDGVKLMLILTDNGGHQTRVSKTFPAR